MAHNLAFDEKSGEAALYLLKEPAWHGLGQVVQEAKSSEEVIKIAHIDWEVQKIDNYINLPSLGLVKSGSSSIVRKDNEAILYNVAQGRYTPLQNKDIFKFLDGLVDCKQDIIYQTAGALGKGEQVFVTVKLPGYLRIKGSDDVIEMFLVVCNSHAGNALSIYFTSVRVVCANTLSASTQGAVNRVYFKHTENLLSTLEGGFDLLGLCRSYNADLEMVLNQLATIKIDEAFERRFINQLLFTPEELEKLAKKELGDSRIALRNNVLQAVQSAPGQDIHEGTALHLYNGVTSYLQNVKSYSSADRKMKGIQLGGEEAVMTQKAMNALLQLVN